MNVKLRKIINYYGIDHQLKYFQSDIFELNKAIIKRRNTGVLESAINGILDVMSPLLNMDHKDYSKEKIKEKVADVMVMLKQIQLYYDISTEEIKNIMKLKIDRQLEKISNEQKGENTELREIGGIVNDRR